MVSCGIGFDLQVELWIDLRGEDGVDILFLRAMGDCLFVGDEW